eukprot:1140421-Pelagomonas_calceolata.AAC.4
MCRVQGINYVSSFSSGRGIFGIAKQGHRLLKGLMPPCATVFFKRHNAARMCLLCHASPEMSLRFKDAFVMPQCANAFFERLHLLCHTHNVAFAVPCPQRCICCAMPTKCANAFSLHVVTFKGYLCYAMPQCANASFGTSLHRKDAFDAPCSSFLVHTLMSFAGCCDLSAFLLALECNHNVKAARGDVPHLAGGLAQKVGHQVKVDLQKMRTILKNEQDQGGVTGPVIGILYSNTYLSLPGCSFPIAAGAAL